MLESARWTEKPQDTIRFLFTTSGTETHNRLEGVVDPPLEPWDALVSTSECTRLDILRSPVRVPGEEKNQNQV